MAVLSRLHVVRSSDLDEATAEAERIFYPNEPADVGHRLRDEGDGRPAWPPSRPGS
ncbi:hypothetical protein G5V59_15685 [Nocardioides sp. W3-2-3]|uniref:hypothetical protein n=1 Tax=Nocardioides convexus TaxID=2712224 RepID=UPI0024181D2B|nr:hypothetical protein [Nocardioides convexus]NHA00875.1 hypothetical protein [Nocardioides convexus]